MNPPRRWVRLWVLFGTLLGMNMPCLDTTTWAASGMVDDIRFWARSDYTRVVIDLSGEARFESHELPANPQAGKPPRVYVDVRGVKVSGKLRSTMPVEKSLVTAVRVSQFDPETVRVVLDLSKTAGVDIFSLPDPYRIVMDVRNGKDPAPSSAQKKDAADPAREGPHPERPGSATKALQPFAEGAASEAVSFAQSSGLKIRRVVIDPGHGGKDPGAIGYRGLKEKDVALQISRRLKQLVEKDLKMEALLTRSTDEFLSLDERTAKAQTLKGDLFVSIHLNANRKRDISGLATYSLDFTYDEESRELAARENQMSEEKMSDLEIILRDLLRTEWINESAILAPLVQKAMIRSVRGMASNAKDLGAKRAPFFVLSAPMPSVLVEASFITNPTEAKHLRNGKYQQEIAEGIVAGIRNYAQTLRHLSVE